MDFVTKAIDFLSKAVTVIGAIVAIVGIIEYGSAQSANDATGKSSAMKTAGGGLVIVIAGLVLIPLIKNMLPS